MYVILINVHQTGQRLRLGTAKQRETGNSNELYVLKDSTIVGNLPWKISWICLVRMKRGGTIACLVNGRRKYSADLPQGGMEIPCILLFKGEPKE